jgi:hypothetical protein
MKITGRILAILSAALMASMAGAAMAAVSLKQRIVPRSAPDADEVRSNRRRRASAGARSTCGMAVASSTCARPRSTLPARDSTSGRCSAAPRSSSRRAGTSRRPSDRGLDAPHLTIEGTAFFGGLGVTTDMPAEAQQSLRDAVARRRHNGNTPAGVPVMETEPVRTA